MLKNNGFTLIELLITFSLFSVLFLAGAVFMSKEGRGQVLSTQALAVSGVADEAFMKALQGKSLNDQGPYKFGVCFFGDTYRVFGTLSDYSSKEDALSQTFHLAQNLQFANANFENSCEGGSNNAVLFAAISGEAGSGGSVYIQNIVSGEHSTLSVSPSGLVLVE